MKTPTPTWQETIDEILDDFGHKAADGAERYGSILEAKSALTQLFKDLVAEANLPNEYQDRLLKIMENENGIDSSS